MIESEREPPKLASLNRMSEQDDDLSYKIEVWDRDEGRAVRVLARASSAQLAHAIFQAACEEHPGTHLVLRRGTNILAERKA
jgi:hypothetical protein